MDLSLFPDCFHFFEIAATQRQTSLQTIALTIWMKVRVMQKKEKNLFPRFLSACVPFQFVRNWVSHSSYLTAAASNHYAAQNCVESRLGT